MKDNRDKQMAQLAGWTWDLNGYAGKVPLYNADDLTMREVRNVFQLDPEPPQMELNDYICEAVRHKDLTYFSFFLHHFEKRLNGVIYRFLTRSGYDRYDPARFLDYKLEVLQMLLFCLPRFDPVQETEFLKYAKHYIQDGLLFCRMMGEAGALHAPLQQVAFQCVLVELRQGGAGAPAAKSGIFVDGSSESLPPTIPSRKSIRSGSTRSRSILGAARWTSRLPP